MKPLLVICLLLFVSCQVPKHTLKEPVQRTQIFNASFDRIWNSLIKILSDDAYPFKIMEKSSGILQTDNLILDANTVYSYSTAKKAFGATFIEGTINLKFFVQSRDSITTVQITPYMQAVFFVYKVITNVNEKHILESNGTLEKSIFDRIEKEIQQ